MPKGGGDIEKYGDIRFDYVWEKIEPDLVEEVKGFWASEDALQGDEKEIEGRAKELIMVARNEDKKIVGVNSASRINVRQLNNQVFYFYRVFVASDSRDKGLMMSLAHKSREFFHKRYLSGEDTSAKGFYLAVESPILKKVQTDAVMVIGGIDHPFIGVDERGRHMRVAWFGEATIG